MFKKYKKLFLIVCEDQNTEPYYFETFKSKIRYETIYLRPVGTGFDPKGVVERALIERDKLTAEAGMEVDITYVVFDKDDANENEARRSRFSEAFEIAKREKLFVAYSNEAFELWLLLHLIDIAPTTPLTRHRIYELLEENIRLSDRHQNFNYEHGNSDVVDIILDIGSQSDAIRRAEFLHSKQDGIEPIMANPSTLIYKLVNELTQWIEFYNYQP
jgi:hypothetical protein